MFIKMPQGVSQNPGAGMCGASKKSFGDPWLLFPLLQAHLLLPPLSEDIWLLWSQGGS